MAQWCEGAKDKMVNIKIADICLSSGFVFNYINRK